MKFDLKTLVYESISVEEFERGWAQFIRKHDLDNND